MTCCTALVWMRPSGCGGTGARRPRADPRSARIIETRKIVLRSLLGQGDEFLAGTPGGTEIASILTARRGATGADRGAVSTTGERGQIEHAVRCAVCFLCPPASESRGRSRPGFGTANPQPFTANARQPAEGASSPVSAVGAASLPQSMPHQQQLVCLQWWGGLQPANARLRARFFTASHGRGSDPSRARQPAWPRLLPADRGQEARVRAAVLGFDFQAAVIVQQPAEGFRRIRVLEIHADALAALQLDLFAGHGRRKIARRAEIARDQVQSLVPRIRLLVEADLAIRVRDAHRGQQRREELARRRIVAPRHGLLRHRGFRRR